MFKLQRHFSLASAVAISILTVTLAFLYQQHAFTSLTKLIEDQNIALSQSFANVIWPKYANYVKSVSSLDGDTLRARPETREIHDTLKSLTVDLPVLKIKMYNLNGLTVYSSEYSQIGASKKSDPAFRSVVRHGKPSTTSSFRDEFLAFDGRVSNRHLIESYLPIHGKNGQVEGVFELYADVTPQVTQIKQSTASVVISLLIGLGMLYCVLLLIVRRADRILHTQYIELEREIGERKRVEEALLKSEDQLKMQIVDLKDRENRLANQGEELVAMAEDLHAAKQEMQFLANHDALTGLPSLRLCKDRLASAMTSDKRSKSRTAVLFIDLDGFKAVNDSMGHEAGDTVLKEVAQRLKSVIRESDTAARIGGDEFILVLPSCEQKDAAGKIARKVIDSLALPIPVNDQVASIGASIGIAFSPDDGETADVLLRNADESMYAIKQSGKNNFGFRS